MIPSTFPIYNYGDLSLSDGALIGACSHCRRGILTEPCQSHYASLVNEPPGFYECPLGFTTRTFYYLAELFAVTGVIAFPRFNTAKERLMAKRYQSHKTSREMIDGFVAFIKEAEVLRADAIQSASEVLPQAFHELRKLNGSVIQHAEKEINKHSTPALITIKGAAELMRNNFDMLEALSNIDLIRTMPLDTTICLLDLAYKMKKVYEERALAKTIQVHIDGVRAIIPGSKKSFPIVPAVLIENAIKYGVSGSAISVQITASENTALLVVENITSHSIDTDNCFERGSRFAGDAAEGGGFGLFLAREVVLAHNGEITCEKHDSTVRMTVTLPLEKVIP